ncbi:MAG: hypothetical protein LBC94_01370 [Desulfovibrio sp.]|jgi:hypothetical protein|nr:hypothetical protein [Desulfovibrio sp.]
MPLPKALLCVLGPQATNETPEESQLRASGFATATIFWQEVEAQTRGWMQLLPVLDDEAVLAWVFAGHPADFTDGLLSRISMLTLGLKRQTPPMTAFVLTGSGGEPAFPALLAHIRVFYGNTTFAAKLAAARVKPRQPLPRPFHITAHVDPLVGQWLEVGPPPGDVWQGFMAGVTGAEVEAFGVGSRGAVPQKATLHYPLCGIKGDWGDVPFSACAAKNEIGRDAACYMRVDGSPKTLFITDYPEDEKKIGSDRKMLTLELF